MPDDRAYLAILQWPDAMSEAQRAGVVARVMGVGERDADLVVRRGTPQIIARLGADAAERLAEFLHSAGVTALAVRQSAMAGQGTQAMPTPWSRWTRRHCR